MKFQTALSDLAMHWHFCLRTSLWWWSCKWFCIPVGYHCSLQQ